MSLAGLRIGLVGPLPPPAGGMAGQTQQLARLLESEGAVVEVIQVNAPYRPAWAGHIPVIRALFRLLPYLFALWRGAGRNDLFHIMANSGWSWHLFAAPAVWIARLRGIPTVVNYRGGEARTFMESSSRWVLPTLKRCGVLAVPSGFLEAVFADFGVRARILPNIVDLARFQPSLFPAQPRIVVARNLEPIYDVGTAIRAFATVHRHFPDASLAIAGSGPERGALERLAQELGLAGAVQFTGRLGREEMAAFYRNASLMLNPSLVDNTPNSVLEALACGIPVVSTRVGGVPHLVEHGRTALLVPPGDPVAMADAALRVLQEPGLSRSLSEAGLGDVKKYTWEAVKPVLENLYDALTTPLPMNHKA